MTYQTRLREILEPNWVLESTEELDKTISAIVSATLELVGDNECYVDVTPAAIVNDVNAVANMSYELFGRTDLRARLRNKIKEGSDD